MEPCIVQDLQDCNGMGPCVRPFTLVVPSLWAHFGHVRPARTAAHLADCDSTIPLARPMSGNEICSAIAHDAPSVLA